ncbi:SusD/RagB family nutrient-binding outer membrane lipoprotein [uncultured Alistipes sp.]|uniref:SusD/RagB family nutrient-binding outer membrane lipoprotein n=1 Tax=uncultured Alistipes sp. TaxID=538949 RepID=UPI0025EEABC2|nr:SusD/RagB family nutrient-binding outer membrane lipoprotein [uncultured Alistipes sp.]
MKNIIIKCAAVALASASLAFSSCSDFDRINEKPMVAGPLQTKPYYALNQAFKGYMQEPYYGERTWILSWAVYAHFNGFDNYGILTGDYSDEWNGGTYGLIAGSIKNSVVAMKLVDEHLAAGTTETEAKFLPNLKLFARIWRVMTMADFTDCFGPMPIEGFQGENPEFKSVEEVYAYLFRELAEVVPAIDLTVVPTDDQAKCDPAFEYDAAKWKKFAVSLWMRLAMRLSEAAPATAKAEFEKAVAAGPGILTADEAFCIQEAPGATWDDYTPVYGRGYRLSVSATFTNLTTNLGVSSAAVLADPGKVLYKTAPGDRYDAFVKPADYLGKRFEKHYELNTDNPTQGFFFDGIPASIDPRALVYYYLPGDNENRLESGYYPTLGNIKAPIVEYMYDTAAEGKNDASRLEKTETEVTYAWNGYTSCFVMDDIATGHNGFVWGGTSMKTIGGCFPALDDRFRNGKTPGRVFFGPWETYFLLAEAAVRGWNVGGTTAEAAYNKGIETSLDYHGMGALYADYIASESYNRLGTSVRFSHTTEPSATVMKYVDGYTGEEKSWTYEYPKAANTLYARVAETPALNDALTKIITQKYIANAPWQALECWSDHRRLGLPFFEIPCSSVAMNTMPEWSKQSYLGAQKPGYFYQRMKYPSSLNNADPAEYRHAVELLGGADEPVTPIWWAIGGH